MSDMIRNYKWIYLLLGVTGLVFCLLPMARTANLDLFVFNLNNKTFSTLLFAAMCLPLLIVPFDYIYSGVYKTGYYNKVTKLMLVIWPVVGFVILLTFKLGLTAFDLESLSFTPYYYIALALLMAQEGFSIYTCYFSLYSV